MSDEQVIPSTADKAGTDGIQQIPAEIPAQESPTAAVARERLIEAIGKEAVFLADQRAGQASEGLEALARAFALVAGGQARAQAGSGVASSRWRETSVSGGFEDSVRTSRLLPVDQGQIAKRETVEFGQR